MFDAVTLQGGPLELSFDQAGQQMWENAVVDCTVQGSIGNETGVISMVARNSRWEG